MKIEFINNWLSLKDEDIRYLTIFNLGYNYYGENDLFFGHNFSLIIFGLGINLTFN